jgi:hypothetical protein
MLKEALDFKQVKMKARKRNKFNGEEEDGILLGHYAASRGNFLPTFRDNQDSSSQLFRGVRPKLFINKIFENFTLHKLLLYVKYRDTPWRSS